MKDDLSSSSVPSNDYPDWLPQYKAALFETDNTKLPERIALADKAITERMRVLAQDGKGTPEERQAILDALNGLSMLERELQKNNRASSGG